MSSEIERKFAQAGLVAAKKLREETERILNMGKKGRVLSSTATRTLRMETEELGDFLRRVEREIPNLLFMVGIEVNGDRVLIEVAVADFLDSIDYYEDEVYTGDQPLVIEVTADWDSRRIVIGEG